MKRSSKGKITWKNVAEEVGGLPSIKFHCGILAVGALKRAIRKYYQNKDVSPDWLKNDLTFEERQALEEEELARMLAKRMKLQEQKYAQCNGNAHADALSDDDFFAYDHAELDGHAFPDANTHQYPDAYSHPDGHLHPQPDVYAIEHANSDVDANGHAHAIVDANIQQHTSAAGPVPGIRAA